MVVSPGPLALPSAAAPSLGTSSPAITTRRLASARARLSAVGASSRSPSLTTTTERTSLFFSYVASKARGDLNDYNGFFGNYPTAIIRPNQRGRLAWDAPHRFLAWGTVGLPWKLEFVPVLDVHSGFPFSAVDAEWNYAGRRNEAGRFPTFVGLDVKVQYPFDFKFRGRRFQFRAGLKVINVLNHFNPRDVQQSLDSPRFGQFFNSVPRLYRIEGGFDF